jgi:hypothetical protein
VALTTIPAVSAESHNELERPQMTNKIRDSGTLREDKAKGLADYFEQRQRQRIMDAAVEEVLNFSTSAEIAKTLRFAVEVLERRDG